MSFDWQIIAAYFTVFLCVLFLLKPVFLFKKASIPKSAACNGCDTCPLACLKGRSYADGK